MPDLDRVTPPLDEVDRCRRAIGPGEVLRETIGVDRRGGDDDMEVVTSVEQSTEITQQEVDVEAPLVGLVDDDRVIATEFRVALQFGEEDAVGHQADPCRRPDTVVEADAESDLRTEFDPELTRHPRCDRPGRDPAGLRVADHTRRSTSGSQAEFRQLGALARPGLTGDDHHAVLPDGGDQRIGVGGDREILGDLRREVVVGVHGHR